MSRRYVIPALLFTFVIVLTVPLLAQNQDSQGTGTSIYGCTVISRPGPYVLAKNITARRTDLKRVAEGRSSCIVIAASFVTLDLGGHIITGPGREEPESTGIRISAITTDSEWPIATQVRNGSVAKFTFGIEIVGAGHAVEQMRLFDNWAGIIFSGGGGIRIKDVVAMSNAIGIYGFDGEGNSVENCQVRSNGGIGIWMHPPGGVEESDGTFGTRIVGNTVSGNEEYGIYATCPSLILQNMAYDNALGNIVVYGSDCTASDNNPEPVQEPEP